MVEAILRNTETGVFWNESAIMNGIPLAIEQIKNIEVDIGIIENKNRKNGKAEGFNLQSKIHYCLPTFPVNKIIVVDGSFINYLYSGLF